MTSETPNGGEASAVEYCFETINWSPLTGYSKPAPLLMVEAAAANGYSWISFDVRTLDLYVAEGGLLDDLKRHIERHGLAMLALHAVLLWDDIPRSEATGIHAIELCEELGATYINVSLQSPINTDAIKSIRRVHDLARRHNLQFTMEYFAHTHVNSLNTLRHILEVAEINGPAIILDAWQFFASRDSWDALEALPVEQIAYVQFSDHAATMTGDFIHETVHHRLLPGDGAFDLARFVGVLKRKGYRGIVGPEILSKESREWPLASYARLAIEKTRVFWK